jgi:hydroxyacylglutathione hydrolase
MKVQQLYTNCLSEAAYFIVDGNEAAVIDPLRDIDAYINLAREHNATIKYIFETHFHADFVSGHLELAKATGAPIIYGPNAQPKFNFLAASDGQEFKLGNVTIKALHTPGHTLESTCYLLSDENGAPQYIFTGDTLFVGDVGRPDLFSGNLTKEELAGMMYESLNIKIKTLPDHIVVYPAHGPGSACGKALGKETYSTIGAQKANNYALKDMTKEEFIKEVTTGLNTPPVYFSINAAINANGYEHLSDFKSTALTAIDVEAFDKMRQQGTYILDTRPSTMFTEGFVPGSVSVGLDGRFAEWAGSIIPYDVDIILVTEEGKEEESVVRLSRVGLDKVKGFLKGSYEAWKNANKPIDMIIDIEPDEFVMDTKFDEKMLIIDVRKQNEYDNGHVESAQLLTLSDLTNPLFMSRIDEDNNVYVHCAGGYRSVIACSLMKKEGYQNIRNVLGGYAKIKEIEDAPLVLPATK